MPVPAGQLAFWLIAAAMTALALAFVLPGLLARRTRASGRSRHAENVALWREALADIERDLERGVLPADELQETRRELLERAAADGVGEPEALENAPQQERTPVIAALVAVALPAAAFGLYAILGEPGVIDGGLEQHLVARPTDGRGWIVLAEREFERERYAEAAAAFERAVNASYKVAIDPAVWCRYADAAGMAQGGQLAGKPAELIAAALAINPPHRCALEMAGSLAYEAGVRAGAASRWRQLSALLGEEQAARRELEAAIARADKLAEMNSASGASRGRALLSAR